MSLKNLNLDEANNLITQMLIRSEYLNRYIYQNGMIRYLVHPFIITIQQLTELLIFGYPKDDFKVRTTFTASQVEPWFKIKMFFQLKSLIKNQFIKRKPKDDLSCPANINRLNNLKNEYNAIQIYKNNHPEIDVKKCNGFLNPCFSFISGSSDGYVTMDNQVIRLIEIKSINYLKTNSIQEFINSTKFEKFGIVQIKSNGILIYKVKPNSKYWYQIQLQLAITGLNDCHLLLYSTYDKNYLFINVERDENFIKKSLLKLQSIYFEYIIEFLRENNVNI